MEELRPGPDPYEMYAGVQKDLTCWRRAAVVGWVFSMFLMLIVVGLAVRPTTVRIPDLSVGRMKLVTAGHKDVVTEAYAKSFFVRMLKQRFGWNSLTVLDDIDDYLQHCHKHLQEREEKELKEPIALDAKRPNEKTTRLRAYMQANIRNDLVMPDSLESVDCRKKERFWYCRVTFDLSTHELLSPSVGPPEKSMKIRAIMAEVPFTRDFLDGLVMYDLTDDPKKGGGGA